MRPSLPPSAGITRCRHLACTASTSPVEPFPHLFLLSFIPLLLDSTHLVIQFAQGDPGSVPAPVPAPNISTKSCWVTSTFGTPRNSKELGCSASMSSDPPLNIMHGDWTPPALEKTSSKPIDSCTFRFIRISHKLQ